MRVLIVEDDPSYALELEMLIENIGYELISVVDNAEDAFKLIEKEEPDLILMDIDIRGERSGIDVAEAIKDKNIPVIFVTAFSDRETYQSARETSPFGYVVKPFDQLTLQSIIEVTVAKLFAEKPPTQEPSEWKSDLITEKGFFIKVSNDLRKINFADILWLQSDGNYTYIVTKDKKMIVKISLTKILQKIAAPFFMRIHKSYIVNIKAIQNINTADNVLIINDQSIPIGRKYKPELVKKISTL